MARGPNKHHNYAKQRIIDAALEVAALGGVEALTFRRVASAAAVSPGRVQHYYPNRAELLQALFDDVQARVQQRVELNLEGVPPVATETIRTILRAAIPQDPTELRELTVVTMFETLALTEPELQQTLRAGRENLLSLLGQLVGSAVDKAELVAKHDPNTTAAALLAVSESVSGAVLHGQFAPAEALGILEYAVTRLLGEDHTSQGENPNDGQTGHTA